MSTNMKRFEFPKFKANDAPMIVRYQEDIKYIASNEEKEVASTPTETPTSNTNLVEEQQIVETIEHPDNHLSADEPLVISEMELAEKINEARSIGFASGYQQREEELEQQHQDLEQKLLACYENISASIAEIGQQLEQGWQDISVSTIEFAQNVVSKVVENIPEIGLAQIVDNILQEVLPKLNTYPELRIQVASPLVPYLEQQCAEWRSRNHYPGEIKVLVDSELTGAACQVAWADGFLVMDTKQIWQEVDHLVKNHFTRVQNSQEPRTLMPEVMMDD